jgi:poly(A) polymerase
MKEKMFCLCGLSREWKVPIFLVGGSVRDSFINKEIKDLDFAVSHHTKALAERAAVLLNGTAFVLDKSRDIFRVALKDKTTMDFSKIRGKSIEEDLYNRDFTINAMAFHVCNGWPMDNNKLIDPYGGKKDAEMKIIRHLHENTFHEDPLRMIRAVRFMAQLNYRIHSKTEELITIEAVKIKKTARERIAEEVFALLKENKTYYYFNYMHRNLNLLDKIFFLKEDPQKDKAALFYPDKIWNKKVSVLKALENLIHVLEGLNPLVKSSYKMHIQEFISGEHTRLQLIKLAILLSKETCSDKCDVEDNMEIEGEVLKKHALNLKVSVKEREVLYRYGTLYKLPFLAFKANENQSEVRYNLFKKTEKETLDVLLIAAANRLTSFELPVSAQELTEVKTFLNTMAYDYLVCYKPVENIASILTGKEVMKILQWKEGSEIGVVMEDVKKAIYCKKVEPEKAPILNYIQTKFKCQGIK